MSAGHKHRSGGMGAADIAKVMAKPEVHTAMQRPTIIDRKHDLPYLAGYSKDGSTIYIDRHLPTSLKIGARDIDPDPFLKVHEHVEKSFIDALGYKYAAAHEIASRAEDRAVVAAGIDRMAYNKALQPYIKADEHERLQSVPPDLDLTPYESDPALMARMKSAMHNGPSKDFAGEEVNADFGARKMA